MSTRAIENFEEIVAVGAYCDMLRELIAEWIGEQSDPDSYTMINSCNSEEDQRRPFSAIMMKTDVEVARSSNAETMADALIELLRKLRGVG